MVNARVDVESAVSAIFENRDSRLGGKRRRGQVGQLTRELQTAKVLETGGSDPPPRTREQRPAGLQLNLMKVRGKVLELSDKKQNRTDVYFVRLHR